MCWRAKNIPCPYMLRKVSMTTHYYRPTHSDINIHTWIRLINIQQKHWHPDVYLSFISFILSLYKWTSSWHLFVNSSLKLMWNQIWIKYWSQNKASVVLEKQILTKIENLSHGYKETLDLHGKEVFHISMCYKSFYVDMFHLQREEQQNHDFFWCQEVRLTMTVPWMTCRFIVSPTEVTTDRFHIYLLSFIYESTL